MTLATAHFCSSASCSASLSCCVVVSRGCVPGGDSRGQADTAKADTTAVVMVLVKSASSTPKGESSVASADGSVCNCTTKAAGSRRSEAGARRSAVLDAVLRGRPRPRPAAQRGAQVTA